MKSFKFLQLMFFCGLLLCIASCRKKNIEPSELSKLPAETHTGANTIGCLVNGKAFLPVSSFFGAPPYHCNYTYMNDRYYFSMGVSQRFYNPTVLNSLIIQTENMQLKEGDTIPLTEYFTQGKASGSYTQYKQLSENIHRTNSTVKGELHITYLDLAKQIVAGTFFFDAINKNGEKIEVRDGRFDMRYSN